MNRLGQESEDGAPQPSAGDYFVVSGDCDTWFVSATMARHIEQCLETIPRPVWVTFVDLTGARVRLRTRKIDSVYQCTAAQRQAERDFHRSLRRERKADQQYDQDDE